MYYIIVIDELRTEKKLTLCFRIIIIAGRWKEYISVTA